MATGNCFVCPGFGRLAIAPCPALYDGLCTLPANAAWEVLPHIVSASLDAEIDTPTRVRTSDTNGFKVTTCPGTASYSMAVSSLLCTDDWLPCYLFSNVTTAALNPNSTCNFEYLNLSTGDELYWAFTPDTRLDSGAIIYFFGFANPGSFTWDNDSSDPVPFDFTVDIVDGPWGAPCAGATGTYAPVWPDTLERDPFTFTVVPPGP